MTDGIGECLSYLPYQREEDTHQREEDTQEEKWGGLIHLGNTTGFETRGGHG